MVTRVKNITTLTGTGAKDWLLQRLSGIVLALYTLFLVAYMIGHSPLTYVIWCGLFACPLMKIFTLLALLSVVWHAWVGIWTILTDYVTCARLRVVLQVLVILTLVVCLWWAIYIIW